MLTFEEVCYKLTMEEEVTLLELLEITSEELVERFRDRIEERQEEIRFKEGFQEDDEEPVEY